MTCAGCTLTGCMGHMSSISPSAYLISLNPLNFQSSISLIFWCRNCDVKFHFLLTCNHKVYTLQRKCHAVSIINISMRILFIVHLLLKTNHLLKYSQRSVSITLRNLRSRMGCDWSRFPKLVKGKDRPRPHSSELQLTSFLLHRTHLKLSLWGLALLWRLLS